MTSKSWRDFLPVHPAADLFPRMSEAQLRELGEDIKKNKLHVPLVLWVRESQDKDPSKCSLLDARNRLDAMELVRIPFELTWHEHGYRWLDSDYTGKDGFVVDVHAGEAYEYVITAKIHRRHFTLDQKRELIANLLKATPEKSNRSSVKLAKPDDKTVASVRREKEATAEFPHLEKTTGHTRHENQVRKCRNRRSFARRITALEFRDSRAGHSLRRGRP